MKKPSKRTFNLPLLLWAWLLCGQAQAADPYTMALQRAVKLEGEQRPAAAAAALLKVEAQYRQDYALQLRLGWLLFEAGDYVRAQRHYRRALNLSPGSKDARLGLGWTLLRRGQQEEAREAFNAVLRRWPEDASALEGQGLCEQTSAIAASPRVAFTGHAYQDHPTKAGALGMSASLPMRILSHGFLSATFRYSRFWLNEGVILDGQANDSFEQYEGYFSAGVVFPLLGLVGHYAYLHDGSGTLGSAQLAGLTARFSPLGDIYLAASVGLYSDMTVYRVAPAWRIPLGGGFSLIPSLALQVATSTDQESHYQLQETTEILPSGSLTLSYSGERLDLWLGGKYGAEVRPAYLDLAAVYNSTDRLAYGAWAGARVKLGQGWSLAAGYELVRLEQLDATYGTTTQSNLHLINLGASWSF